jgi:hypothetical protein
MNSVVSGTGINFEASEKICNIQNFLFPLFDVNIGLLPNKPLASTIRIITYCASQGKINKAFCACTGSSDGCTSQCKHRTVMKFIQIEDINMSSFCCTREECSTQHPTKDALLASEMKNNQLSNTKTADQMKEAKDSTER